MRALIRISLSLLTLLLPGTAFAYEKVQLWAERGDQSVVTTVGGTPIQSQRSCAGGTYEVLLTGTSTRATIYSTRTGTAITQPVAIPSSGLIEFYIDGSTVIDVSVSGCGTTFLLLRDFVPPVSGNGGICNVIAYGADNSGVNAADTAFASAKNACAALSPRGVVYMPRGTYKLTTGNIDITALNGLSFIGDGTGNTTIDLAHATNDLFKWTFNTRDITMRDFTVTSSVTRTGGWILKGNTDPLAAAELQNSIIQRVNVRNQVNGFWFNRYSEVSVNECILHAFVGTGGIGIKAGQTASNNQGAGLYITGKTIITGFDRDLSSGATPAYLYYGLWIEDTATIDADTLIVLATIMDGIHIVGGAAGSGAHFFNNVVVDVTKDGYGYNIIGSGTGGINWVQILGGWVASAGWKPPTTTNWTTTSPSAHGIHITATSSSVPVNDIQIQNVMVRNNSGSGIYITTPGANNALIDGNDFSDNGFGATANDNHAIYVNVGAGQIGPTIINNRERTSNGAAFRNSSTASRIAVQSNVFEKGFALSVFPYVFNLNRTLNEPATFSEVRGWSLLSSSSAITNTAALTAFDKSITLNANEVPFLFPGSRIVIHASGKVTSNGLATLFMRVRFGGSPVMEILPTPPSATDKPWYAEAELVVRAPGAAGTLVLGPGHGATGSMNPISSNTSPTVFGMDLTTPKTVDVQVAWGTASTAYSITLESLTVTVIPPFSTTP